MNLLVQYSYVPQSWCPCCPHLHLQLEHLVNAEQFFCNVLADHSVTSAARMQSRNGRLVGVMREAKQRKQVKWSRKRQPLCHCGHNRWQHAVNNTGFCKLLFALWCRAVELWALCLGCWAFKEGAFHNLSLWLRSSFVWRTSA